MLRTRQHEQPIGSLLIGAVCVLGLIGIETRVSHAVTRVIDLDAWTEYDPKFGVGIQSLSGNTGSGFTSSHSGSVSQLQDRPRVIQEFEGLDVSQVGQKVTATFDVLFNTVPSTGGNAGDTRFRFGFGDRTSNQGLVPMMVDLGQTSGSSFRQRYDSSLTDGAGTFATDDYSGFLSASGTFGSGEGNPTSPDDSAGVGGIDDNTTIHSFIVTAERVERNVDTTFPPDGIADTVVGGWYATTSWTSNEPGAGTAFVGTNNTGGFTAFDVDTGLGVYQEDFFNENGRIENFDTMGFLIYTDDPFADTGSMGSYTISNFVLEYEDAQVLQGDFNLDGSVDAADYTVWRDNFGAADEAALNGAGDGMNGVDQEDYNLWSANFGLPSATSSAVATPEPSTTLLLLAAISGVVTRGSRR